MNNDFKKIWQLADSVSVPHATVLMLGEDPENGIANFEQGEMWCSYDFDNYHNVFSSLKSAIIKGSLKAKLAYQALPPTADMDHAQTMVILDRGSINALRSNDEIQSPGEITSTELADKIIVEREPVWHKTMIDVDDLCLTSALMGPNSAI